MAHEALANSGLHLDELNKIRVLEPEIAVQTRELKEECKDFVDKLGDFKSIVGTFMKVVDCVSTEVDKEKIKAIATRNLLKSVSKQRDGKQQQLISLISEKKMQLERLRMQHDALLKEEHRQTEFIEQFILQK